MSRRSDQIPLKLLSRARAPTIPSSGLPRSGFVHGSRPGGSVARGLAGFGRHLSKTSHSARRLRTDPRQTSAAANVMNRIGSADGATVLFPRLHWRSSRWFGARKRSAATCTLRSPSFTAGFGHTALISTSFETIAPGRSTTAIGRHLSAKAHCPATAGLSLLIRNCFGNMHRHSGNTLTAFWKFFAAYSDRVKDSWPRWIEAVISAPDPRGERA